MTRLRAAVSFLFIGCALSCDRNADVEGMSLETVGRRVVQLRTLTQLLPNRPTHVAADRLGQVFWVQENQTGQDVLFMIAEAGIPRATRLTTANIVTALEESGDASGSGKVSGNIRSLAPADRGVYFYFYGFKGSTPKACIGLYLPHSARIRIVADTSRLEEVSGMGRSMQLARGTLVASGEKMWLWLRHTDASVFLSFDGRLGAPLAVPELKIPFTKIVSDGQPVSLLQSEGELAAGPAGSLLVLDFGAALLWRIEPDGKADALFSLTGLPRQISLPTATADDHILFFAAESQKIGSELEILTRQDLPKISYPALIDLFRSEIQFISRDHFRAPAGFPVATLRLGRLVPESMGSYVSYDASSGALMRVKIVEQD